MELFKTDTSKVISFSSQSGHKFSFYKVLPRFDEVSLV